MPATEDTGEFYFSFYPEWVQVVPSGCNEDNRNQRSRHAEPLWARNRFL
jgi:hypothetical protein